MRLSDRVLVDEFVDFLRRADWIAVISDVEAHAEGIAVEVEVPEAYDETQARKELSLYLQGWDAVYPDSGAELLD